MDLRLGSRKMYKVLMLLVVVAIISLIITIFFGDTGVIDRFNLAIAYLGWLSTLLIYILTALEKDNENATPRKIKVVTANDLLTLQQNVNEELKGLKNIVGVEIVDYKTAIIIYY